ncbi:MAG: triose-phosphate isomerase [Desulfovibrionaceae bacterium]|nr:triose-phosphate isomerase [Desulfovibrionaceae bacterium]
MSTRYIIANWKMNIKGDEAREYAIGLEQYLVNNPTQSTVVLCPPILCLPSISSVKPTQFSLGVQNFYPMDSGSVTGEHSLAMLDSLNVSYAIIGHSERRILFNEDEDSIARKIKYAVEKGYSIILCIGESREERELGITQQRIEQQLQVLSSLPKESTTPICIAYEPLWAIGTGIIPQVDEIATCVQSIKKYIDENLDQYSKSIYTLYGGSVTQDNVASILAIDGIHGVLVGSASLQLDSFTGIIGKS